METRDIANVIIGVGVVVAGAMIIRKAIECEAAVDIELVNYKRDLKTRRYESDNRVTVTKKSYVTKYYKVKFISRIGISNMYYDCKATVRASGGRIEIVRLETNANELYAQHVERKRKHVESTNGYYIDDSIDRGFKRDIRKFEDLVGKSSEYVIRKSAQANTENLLKHVGLIPAIKTFKEA